MTKEDKELLLKDLCARLPYDVVVRCYFVDGGGEEVLDTDDIADLLYNEENSEFPMYKPYLRPMSSMTEEEKNELRKEQIKDEQLFTDCIKNHPEMRGLVIPHFAADWCNKNMFDYSGLIEKGLAIAVTENNNPYK